MNNIPNNTNPINFWNLISNYSIEIPIIQRDYAQGRADIEITKKRERFLNVLHLALTNVDKYQTLDFIYGDEKHGKFQPLDGQQRLTTLFLLHWFIAAKENKLNDIAAPILSKFTYETRISSREFCEKLATQSCTLVDGESVSSTIKTKTNWWVLSWEKDPTIKAMLNMLDAIQSKFIEPNLWDQLISDKITFINIPIRNFGLSDDLYVKMNARGKFLTEFENWKAEFENQISVNGWGDKDVLTETFAHKMDMEWTDLFWKYRDSENKIDAKIWNFIRCIQLTNVAQTRSNTETITLDKFPYYDPTAYSESNYQYLYDSLSIWAGADNSQSNKCNLKWIDDSFENTIFKNIINEKTTYPNLVLFYAETIALKNKITLNSIDALDWMRVIRNIVKNSTIDSFITFRGAILLIEELSKGCTCIYKWLSDNNINSKFASEQVKEEQKKAKLICYNEDWKTEIFRCEDSDLCVGKISFALKCINYNDDTVNFDFSKFIKVTNVIITYLSKISEQTVKHSLWRMFFTVDDHKFYNYWWSWSYVVDCRKRKMPNDIIALRDYCNKDSSQSYAITVVKALLTITLDEYLSKYSPPINIPKWKLKIINNKTLFKHCTEGYLCISDDERKCWLIDGKKPSDLNRYKKI